MDHEFYEKLLYQKQLSTQKWEMLGILYLAAMEICSLTSIPNVFLITNILASSVPFYVTLN